MTKFCDGHIAGYSSVGIAGQVSLLGTGVYPGTAGYGSAVAPCCGKLACNKILS